MTKNNENEQEQSVTFDALDASLDDLLKAADAEGVRDKLHKAYGGVSVEHSGHTDERGAVGGGVADAGDMGGLDNMMIGKMVAKLSDAGFSDAQIKAFMTGKQEDEEDDEEDDDDDGEDYGKSQTAGKPRSADTSPDDDDAPLYKSFTEDPDIEDGVDAAPFMEALTAKTTQTLDNFRKSLRKGFGEQSKVNQAMAGSMYELGQLVKSQQAVINELGHRLGIVERQPMPQKGQTAAPLQKSMPGEAGHAPGKLQKSHVLGTLGYLNLVKGEKQICGEPTSQIIAKLETTGEANPEVLQHVQRFLATNPSEAEAAKAF